MSRAAQATRTRATAGASDALRDLALGLLMLVLLPAGGLLAGAVAFGAGLAAVGLSLYAALARRPVCGACWKLCLRMPCSAWWCASCLREIVPAAGERRP